MSSLKDDMARDIRDNFLGMEEFAEYRTIAGKRVLCVLYENGARPADGYGISSSTYTLQAAAEDMPKIKTGDTLTIDGQVWIINAFKVEYGMAVLQIERNR